MTGLAIGGYQFIGGNLVGYSDNPNTYVTKGYNINDIFYSVINIITDKVKVAPWGVWEIVDESSLKKCYSILRQKSFRPGDYKKAVNFFHKALQPAKNPGKWADLLLRPNDYDSMSDIAGNIAGFELITGNGYLWADRLDAGVNEGMPQALWVMPSQVVNIYATKGWPAKVIGYQLYSPQNKVDFDVEEVMQVKYTNYDYTIESSQLIGTSPVKALLKRLNRNNSAMDASAAQLQNRGLQHIIYIDEPGLTAADRTTAMGQMSELKKKLINEYTGPDNFGKIAGTSYKVGAVNLGSTAQDMQLLESERNDLRFFCSAYGVPSQLLNDPDNKTFNNQQEGEKALTTRCALPRLTSFRDKLNMKAHESWGLPKNLLIDFDMTVFPELNDDLEAMSKWTLPLAKATGMPPNDLLALMGIEQIDNDYYNQPRVYPDMGETLAESQLSVVDNVLNNNNGEAGIQP